MKHFLMDSGLVACVEKFDHRIFGLLSIKNAVSDIKLSSDFERRLVSMSIKLTPPLDKGNKAKITWITKQLENRV